MVKQGYKSTSVGIIPTDWEVKRLGEVAKVNMGQSPLSQYYNSVGFGLPLVQGNADIKNRETIIRNYTSSITKKGYAGDIIMSVRAPVGEISKATFDCCLGRGVCSLKFENEFLFYYLVYFETFWVKLSTGSTFDSVNSKQVKDLQIPIPPLSEQILIAKALSDTDELIANLESLILKKQLIKQGTMQQLLQPKHGWEVKRLGEICDIKKGKGISKSLLNNNGKYKCILYGELFTTYDEVITNIQSRTDFKDSFISKNGDILFPGSTTTNGLDLAKASTVLESGILLGGDIIVVRSKDYIYNSVFLVYFLNLIKRFEIAQKTKGITIHHLYCSDLGNVKANFPPLAEQNKIATILSDMDNEITLLELKLHKYRNIKQGMMQSLLTGQIRLV